MSTTEQLGGHAQQVAGAAKEETKQLAASATEHATTIIKQSTDELRRHGDEQGKRIAASLRDLCEDLRAMAEHSTGRSPAGDLARGIADGAEQVAQQLDSDGVAGVGRRLAGAGRSRPGMFLLACGGAGLLAGRLLRNTDTAAITSAVSGNGSGAPAGAPGMSGDQGTTVGGAGAAPVDPVIELAGTAAGAERIEPEIGDAIAAGVTGLAPDAGSAGRPR